MSTAIGIVESRNIRVMRIADNMRNVAVTEGDKVEAAIKFGWTIDAYPVNEIAEAVAAVSQADIDALVEEYYSKYEILLEGRDEKEFREHVAVQAGIEIGFERFLEEKNYQAIVTHFGDLGALKAASGAGNPKTHGKRLRIWRRRRLEDSCHGSPDESYDSRNERREGNFLHGRLYIQPCTGKRGNPAGAYA